MKVSIVNNNFFIYFFLLRFDTLPYIKLKIIRLFSIIKIEYFVFKISMYYNNSCITYFCILQFFYKKCVSAFSK